MIFPFATLIFASTIFASPTNHTTQDTDSEEYRDPTIALFTLNPANNSKIEFELRFEHHQGFYIFYSHYQEITLIDGTEVGIDGGVILDKNDEGLVENDVEVSTSEGVKKFQTNYFLKDGVLEWYSVDFGDSSVTVQMNYLPNGVVDFVDATARSSEIDSFNLAIKYGGSVLRTTGAEGSSPMRMRQYTVRRGF